MYECVRCLQRLCATERLTIIAGDCNLPDVDCSCYSGPNTAIYDASLNFVNNYGFCQYVQRPTRDNNILDIFIATSDTFLSDLSVTVPLSTSDHNTIILKTNLVGKATNSTASVPYWDFEHAEYAAVNTYLKSIDWNDMFSNSITAEDCWNSFSQVLHDVFNFFIPVRFTTASSSNRKRKRIRYPHYIRSIRKQKAILWKRWNMSNASEDKTLYKTAAVKCKKAIDKFHAAKELALVRKNNFGNFFSLINNRLKSNIASVGLTRRPASADRTARAANFRRDLEAT